MSGCFIPGRSLRAESGWRSTAGTDATLHIINALEGNSGRYRCAVSQQVGGQAVTIYSQEVKLTIDRNRASLSLTHNGPASELYLSAMNLPLQLPLAALRRLNPQGRCCLSITHYPDPEPNPAYDQNDPMRPTARLSTRNLRSRSFAAP
jgi:hypothetical protein